MQSLQDSIDFLAEYVIAVEYSFIVDEIDRFIDCDSWINYVLTETAYGAANIVAFRDWSDGEMRRDLRELWANYTQGRELIKAARLAQI
jgi:hypothetical protein